MRKIVPIVEGPGDMVATPLLVRNILGETLDRYDIGVGTPKKTNGKSNMIKRLESFIKYAEITPGCAGILVLFDGDTECPITRVKDFSERCGNLGCAFPIAIVCAVTEYESWFLASLESLKSGGQSIIPESASFTGSCESIQGPKEWINRQLPSGRRYKETQDQASLTSLIDLTQANTNSRSFSRLSNAVSELVVAIDAGTANVTPILTNL